MKLGREIDYHGARTYGAEAPGLDRLKLVLDWLVSIAFGRLGTRRRKPSSQLQPEQATFTLLGVTSRVSRRMQADPFPLAPGKNDNRRGALRLRNED